MNKNNWMEGSHCYVLRDEKNINPLLVMVTHFNNEQWRQSSEKLMLRTRLNLLYYPPHMVRIIPVYIFFRNCAYNMLRK